MKRKLLISIWLVITLLVFVYAQNPSRLKESGFNSAFTIPLETPYEQYIELMTHVIANARVETKNKDAIVAMNSPFIFKPAVKPVNGIYPKGILLIHGLSDSPYFLRAVGKYFAEKGFLVYGLLLPGHGTVPGDLLNVKNDEWIKATHYGMVQLKKNANNVYMGGFSMGALLSTHYVLTNKNHDVKGLFLFAPCFAIYSKLAWMAPVIGTFKDWESIEDDVDYTKYQSFTFNGVTQTYRLVKKVDSIFENGNKINVPVFVAQSIDDRTVSTERTLFVMKNYVTGKKMFILYTTEPEKDYDGEDNFVITVNSYLPQEKILNIPHICITIPPDDPHYGKNGDYRNCLYYKPNSLERQQCLTDPEIWKGENTKENIEKYKVITRLTYNPYFNDMCKKMGEFLSAIEK
ncbi:MAG: alpha/beta fold hydrolase [Spirochaetota bacterium]